MTSRRLIWGTALPGMAAAAPVGSKFCIGTLPYQIRVASVRRCWWKKAGDWAGVPDGTPLPLKQTFRQNNVVLRHALPAEAVGQLGRGAGVRGVLQPAGIGQTANDLLPAYSAPVNAPGFRPHPVWKAAAHPRPAAAACDKIPARAGPVPGRATAGAACWTKGLPRAPPG